MLPRIGTAVEQQEASPPFPYDDPSYPEAHDKMWAEEREEAWFTVRFVRGLVLRTGADSWLDGACGTGGHLRNSGLQLGRMVGADRSAAMLDYAREHDAVGVEFVECDLRVFSTTRIRSPSMA